MADRGRRDRPQRAGVTTGPYRLVRNPVFTFLGLAIMVPNAVAVAGLTLTGIQIRVRLVEERTCAAFTAPPTPVMPPGPSTSCPARAAFGQALAPRAEAYGAGSVTCALKPVSPARNRGRQAGLPRGTCLLMVYRYGICTTSRDSFGVAGSA